MASELPPPSIETAVVATTEPQTIPALAEVHRDSASDAEAPQLARVLRQLVLLLSKRFLGLLVAFAGSGITLALVTALLLPPLVFLGAGVWAFATSVRTLWDIAHQLLRYDLAGASSRLPAIDLATRVALASGGY